jgi:hypothetical protein
MAGSKRKQTTTARAALALRRSGRLVDKKHSVEPESEDDARPVVKQQRSGTLLKTSPLTREDTMQDLPDTPTSVPCPTMHPCPKMQPPPEPEGELTLSLLRALNSCAQGLVVG